jgi:hypothetical protein
MAEEVHACACVLIVCMYWWEGGVLHDDSMKGEGKEGGWKTRRR